MKREREREREREKEIEREREGEREREKGKARSDGETIRAHEAHFRRNYTCIRLLQKFALNVVFVLTAIFKLCRC
jgi:hypothetical protein